VELLDTGIVAKAEMLNSQNLQGGPVSAPGPENALLEKEHGGLVRNLKAVQSSFGSDMLCLAVSLKYLERIANNPKNKNYLEAAAPKTALVIRGLLKESQAGNLELLKPRSVCHTIARAIAG
jgi:hypothetical protein